MKTSTELRAEARSKLSEKLGDCIILTLIFYGISMAINFLAQIIPFASIFSLIITIPLSYALSICFLKLIRNDNFSYSDIFFAIPSKEAFNNFTKIWSIVGNMCLKLIVPIILIVVSIIIFFISAFIPSFAYVAEDYEVIIMIFSIICMFIGFIVYFVGIILLTIKSYYYALSTYLLYDNPNLTGKEIINLSEQLMQNQRANLFFLQLSFAGWMILALLTCGIGMIFLIPYMQLASAYFYQDRIQNN